MTATRVLLWASVLASSACAPSSESNYSSGTGACSVLVPGDFYLGGLYPYGPAWPEGGNWDIVSKRALSRINRSPRGFRQEQKLGMVTCDGGCDTGLARDVFAELTGKGPGSAHASNLSVGAIIGPACSSSASTFFDQLKNAQVPVIAPSVESDRYTVGDDGDFYFRTAVSVSRYAPAHALYLRQVKAAQKLAIVYDSGDAWAMDMAPLVKSTFESAGGTAQMVRFSHSDSVPVSGQSTVALLDVEGGPDAVLLVALIQPAAIVFNASLTHSWTKNARPLTWDVAGASSQELATLVSNNAAIEGVGGIEPRPSPSSIRDELLSTFEDPSASQIDRVFDAVMLAASGMYLAADPADGVAVRDGLRKTSRGNALGPEDWEAIAAQLDTAGEYNYQGISGPADFDANGDVQSDVWRWSFKAGRIQREGCWDAALKSCP